ncbi:MAG: C4-dicarboxylate transporter DctQ subunit [Candidatus Endobugula sp.]|jgi:C4-dicarboxylate transporter DctQ subunit
MNKVLTFIDRFEENFIAIVLALMVFISFSQVIARYVFNSGWGGALELTQVLFAWLILFGMSYGIKVGSHIGVDALIRTFPKPVFRFFALFGAGVCIMYGVTLFSAEWLTVFGVESKGGAWYYFSKIYSIGIGMEDIVLPDFFPEALYGGERLPRWIAYLILPVGLVLFVLRSVQAFVAIWKGEREMIIASHEAEELLEEHQKAKEESGEAGSDIDESHTKGGSK